MSVSSAPTEATSREERPPLTPEQRAIVEWGEGPAVVIAGAGTGKTRVIVERVASFAAFKEFDRRFSGPPRHARRMSYEPNAEGMCEPEYAEVFGVPFSFIPTDTGAELT